jgi:hypothetical protein
LRHWAPLAAILLIFLSAPGCGGDGGSGAPVGSGGSGNHGAPGAPGAPGGAGAGGAGGGGAGGDAGALGSPMDIPFESLRQGQPIDQVRADLVSAVRGACGGGRLCVRLRTEARDVLPFTTCQYVGTEPPVTGDPPDQRIRIKRGATLVIITGTQPCAASPGPDVSPDGGDGEGDGGGQNGGTGGDGQDGGTGGDGQDGGTGGTGGEGGTGGPGDNQPRGTG